MAGANVFRALLLGLAALGLLRPAPALAAVEVAFYSKELGVTFPHAFITVKGTVDASGEKVDASYGFTAKTVSPAVLMGSVAGEIIPSAPSYIAHSVRHFALRLTDAQYAHLMDEIGKWRALKQPSYNLNHRNCVFFVADLAAALGLKAETPRRLMKRPTSYLHALVEANRPLLAAMGATIDDEPPARSR